MMFGAVWSHLDILAEAIANLTLKAAVFAYMLAAIRPVQESGI